MKKSIVMFTLAAMVVACTQIEPKHFEPPDGHLKPVTKKIIDADIPELIETVPVLPEPGELVPQERYTVVVNEVPAKELLFAMARDAKLNVDIHSDIEGLVTINAVEQTLPQILKRISKQVDIYYEYDGENLFISKDTPFLRTYRVGYVNLSRDMASTSTVFTQIASTSDGNSQTAGGRGGARGANTSMTEVISGSSHRFWERLVSNISAILGEEISANSPRGELPVTNTVIPNPESGFISVRATAKQHEQIQSFLDRVVTSSKRQVLIQATIVEVHLNKRYQAGIDWDVLSSGAFSIASKTTTGLPAFSTAALSSFVIETDDGDGNMNNINAKISLLDEFGDINILSSPQIMTLNNQTAMLKVVENVVYFEVNAETTATQGVATTSVDTAARTVPVGIVMAVTPQIDENGVITMVVRPTISRFIEFVNDPNPQLTIPNPVPQIAVREMESVLRMTNGQIGVMGGLMTDASRDSDAGLPGLKDKGFFGNLFKTTAAEYTKSELVIFIRPIIVANPGIDADLRDYKQYLLDDT